MMTTRELLEDGKNGWISDERNEEFSSGQQSTIRGGKAINIAATT